MVEHIVLYELKNIPHSVLQEVIRCYEKCKEEVKGFISLKHGWNGSLKVEFDGGFHYGWIMTFDTPESILEFNTNRWHTEAKKVLNGYLGKKLIFDIR